MKSSIIFKNRIENRNLIFIEEHILSLEQKGQLAIFDIQRSWILNFLNLEISKTLKTL